MFPPGPGRFARMMDYEDPTCESPHNTPWGVRCNNSGHSHRSAIYGSFTVRGRWLQDKVSGKCKTCTILGSQHSGPCYKPDRITSPKRDLLEAKFDLVDSRFDQAERTSSDIRQSHSRCMMTELPYEILRQTLDHIVPSGCVYQFIPSKQGLLAIMIVQRFAPYCRRYPDVVQLELAATCRILHQHICEILYGANEFVFNIAVSPLVIQTRSTDHSQYESWSRLLLQQPNPVAPITAQTAPFLRRISLLVVLPIHYYEKEVNKLHSLLCDFTDILKLCDDVQQLSIDLEIQSRPILQDQYLEVDRLQLGYDKDTQKWCIDMDGSGPTSAWLWEARKELRPLLRLESVRNSLPTDRHAIHVENQTKAE